MNLHETEARKQLVEIKPKLFLETDGVADRMFILGFMKGSRWQLRKTMLDIGIPLAEIEEIEKSVET